MIRKLVLAILFGLFGATPAMAQSWATKMFTKTSHDFGTVAKGAKAECRFEFENIYEEDVHIAEVRTSCGCTTPSVEKKTLKTWEKSAVVAAFNTRAFDGKRGSTITVVIDKPYYAEVRLRVDGVIRTDISFEPGQVELGEVDYGQVAEKRVRVNYVGRSSWRITDVRSDNDHFEVELAELERANGRVGYEMLVRLKETAPQGFLSDQLTILSDTDSVGVALQVTGRVVPPVQVSPSLLTLGNVTPGQKITKQLIIQGKTPFKVTGVNCPDGCFEFKVNDQAKKLHVIPVTFTAGDAPTKIEQKIEIQTDLAGGTSACCIATVVVTDGNGSKRTSD